MTTTNASHRLRLKVEGLVKKVFRASSDLSQNISQTIAPPAFNRRSVADYYLKGSGIEIGALHNPLQVSDTVRVQYVDRMSVADLKTHYAELSDLKLVEVDLLDDGETLTRIASDSQDFVIANHFIEHCQNPIQTIHSMLRVLKPAGILYLGIPDKRYTFDVHRPLTTIDHLLKDYDEGPEWSKRQHFLEWAKFPALGHTSEQEGQDDPRIAAEADRLLAMDYSIHYHVWTQTELLELVATLQKKLQFGFEVELFLKHKDEMILILRKNA